MLICFSLVLGAAVLPAAEPPARIASTVRPDPRSGRLVRTTVVTPKVVEPKVVNPAMPSTQTAGGGEVRQIIEETAKANEVDPLLVHSVIRAESNYNPYAISPKGALGIMQLIPATARRFGAINSFDVRENITAGVKYLKYLQDMFKDDRLALAAYNAGEGAVIKYRDIPPYPETEQYVYKVGKSYGEARRQQAAAMPAAPPVVPVVPAQPQVEPLRALEVATDAEGRIVLRTR